MHNKMGPLVDIGSESRPGGPFEPGPDNQPGLLSGWRSVLDLQIL